MSTLFEHELVGPKKNLLLHQECMTLPSKGKKDKNLLPANQILVTDICTIRMIFLLSEFSVLSKIYFTMKKS